ncbi:MULTISPECIES: ArgP/LysG family DNA-binding transcriptional regulator [Janthinobacterium]|uniref:ArgP/LysG family DNA-binding transcriptional regulator n=1 Tax=Janthinobacterium kumbetense TaxID=2950280 RepID=A0ABT0WYV8_9BURK|nr:MULTISPECIES: ArgP/LysG family DNA-binding transcriptional regulator [Janthinobacterium]MCM2568729.1 ArgP/LysG family DNA-binding transcriptional regulator [Janthinobacterium kumbetense]MDN2674716.1 ArgP/LysG family DNA-binding transcriptional regulator [Janthinobacterium sp. SUN026]MDN2680610.1 ArgP/LysG family DNA-binding transcriptional regulator [Janthinobacterium sp. SUN033]MED5617488.1 ArgP/LysG family DNA-binding transcriptional regulator [Janthinobacterium sp. P210005]
MGSLDYRALAVLDAVASHGSFDKAALALGITQSAVSQRIKALEDASGRLLIIRGQPAVPTGLGQRLIVHHRNVKLMEASLDIDLGNSVSMPEIAIAIDADSLATWFPDTLSALLAPPRCQLDVRLADSDSALQMVRDGSVFGCVAAESGTAIDAAAATSVTPLGTLRYVCVATPVFAGHWFGDGFIAEAVQLAPAVVGQHGLLARFLAEQLNMREPFPHHTLPVEAARRGCVQDGLAYGLMPQRLAAQALATDRLVDLMPGSTLDVPLSWHAWTLDTPFTKLLSEQIVKSARDYLN